MKKILIAILVFIAFSCEEQKKKEKQIYYFLQNTTKEFKDILAKEDQLEKHR